MPSVPDESHVGFIQKENPMLAPILPSPATEAIKAELTLSSALSSVPSNDKNFVLSHSKQE